MPSTNFLTAKGTPWGVVISALVRAYVATDPDRSSDLKFNDLDVTISINGHTLGDTTHTVFVDLLNKEGNLSSMSELRSKMESLISGIRDAAGEASPADIVETVITDAADRVASVDLAHLIHDYMSSGDYNTSGSLDRILTNANEMDQILNQL
jgi:hypothetical protein